MSLADATVMLKPVRAAVRTSQAKTNPATSRIFRWILLQFGWLRSSQGVTLRC